MKNQITIEEARDILGNEAANMTDDEIVRLVDDLEVIARHALEEAQKIDYPIDATNSRLENN